MHPFVVLVFLPCGGIKREKGKDFAICKLVSLHLWMISVVLEKLVLKRFCDASYNLCFYMSNSSYHDTKSH